MEDTMTSKEITELILISAFVVVGVRFAFYVMKAFFE